MSIFAINTHDLKINLQMMLHFSFYDATGPTRQKYSVLYPEKNKFYIDHITNILLMGEE